MSRDEARELLKEVMWRGRAKSPLTMARMIALDFGMAPNNTLITLLAYWKQAIERERETGGER